MIVVQITDLTLRRAVFRAAHPEEDVFDDQRTPEALELGFPRLLVRDAPRPLWTPASSLSVLDVDDAMLRRWERDRLDRELPRSRADDLAARLAVVMAPTASEATWVDRAMAELARAAGTRLPVPLRTFARRVLEFPAYYRTLEPLAAACGTSPGALKARFRRRGLPSPSIHLRWLRTLAVAELMADPSVTVAVAARRLGFTSDGNLCRTMANATGMAPTELRSPSGRLRLLTTFAGHHLGSEELGGWAGLHELFPADRVA
jgi:AraC-like DNA-binding protein